MTRTRPPHAPPPRQALALLLACIAVALIATAVAAASVATSGDAFSLPSPAARGRSGAGRSILINVARSGCDLQVR